MKGVRLRVIACFLLSVLFSISAAPATAFARVAETPAIADVSGDMLTFDVADFVASEAEAPPLAGWHRQALPDSWRRNHPTLDGFAWYRIVFDLRRVPPTPRILYVPHLSIAAAIWLNGSVLDASIVYDDRNGKMHTQMSDVPLHMMLPAGLFRVGPNVLYVRLQGSPRIRSGLSAIALATPAAVAADWRWRYAVQVIVPYCLIVILTCALAFLMAHLLRQRKVDALHFALAAALIASASYLSVNSPIGRPEREALRVASTTVLFWLLCIVGYRVAGIRLRGFLPVLHLVSALTIVVAVALACMGLASDRVWLIVWPHIALRAVVVVLVAMRAWRNRSLKYAALAATAAIWLVTLAQSIMILMEALPWDSMRWSVAGALPMCLVLLYFFAERFILDREEAVSMQQQALLAERARILQDMHDGMGAHLISALHLARRHDVDRAELANTIEASLQDLRLIIDSLDVTEHDLLPLLGNIRFRLEPNLARLGIASKWDVRLPLPELDYLTPDAALAILRIVQEAINNAIKHAGATTIAITIGSDDTAVVIEVADDGKGFVPDAPRANARGLLGMRSRAQKLGGALIVNGGPPGTSVTLRLPLRVEQPPARRRRFRFPGRY